MKFSIKNRVITCTDESLVGDNGDYIAEFTFDGEWEEDIKLARFLRNGTYLDVVLDENNQCIIPRQKLKKGYLSVGCYSEEKTTTPCEVFVEKSIKESGDLDERVDEDLIVQLLRIIREVEETVNYVKEELNNYAPKDIIVDDLDKATENTEIVVDKENSKTVQVFTTKETDIRYARKNIIADDKSQVDSNTRILYDKEKSKTAQFFTVGESDSRYARENIVATNESEVDSHTKILYDREKGKTVEFYSAQEVDKLLNNLKNEIMDFINTL